jgi:hypothetical protein
MGKLLYLFSNPSSFQIIRQKFGGTLNTVANQRAGLWSKKGKGLDDTS